MTNKNNEKINMSFIIPVYNVEKYLSSCIDSLMQQGDLCFEIILVNDGSTDLSGIIADQYAKKDSRIHVIHKKNCGASSARNAGLVTAQGEYIAFIDSDDWVKENSLYELYREASGHSADVVMGKILYCHQNGKTSNPYRPVPKDLINVPLTGKDSFIQLVKSMAYTPMAWNYIYRRSFLDGIQARFEEGIMAEDELWSPVVICQAEKMMIFDIEFYYYRQQYESVMRTTQLPRRLKSVFLVVDKLFEFADRFDFSGEDAELKNWLYVNIFKLYSITFKLVSQLKDSSVILPAHHLDRFWKDCSKMDSKPQKICREYYLNAEKNLKVYTEWRVSDFVAPIPSQQKSGKKLMLIYNTQWGFDLKLNIWNFPADWTITTDRQYFRQAHAVVFHLPEMPQELEDDLDKRHGQIWVAWCMESEKNHQWIRRDPQFMDSFDLWMSYQQNSDVVYPYYRYAYSNILTQQLGPHNRTCKHLFEKVKDVKSKNYLQNLMEHLEIDMYSVKGLPTDRRKERLDVFRKHKFVIAFENAIDEDYVTDIFFDPLLAGSVPVYLGAPNIEDFAPGDNCFVDVRQYENPQLLVNLINACYDDEHLYDKFFEWKKKPFRQSFLQKIEEQKEHPLVRLCWKVDELKAQII